MKKTLRGSSAVRKRGDVALALERRAGGHDERHLELGGDDLGQRGLAEAGRAGEQHVVERLAPRGGRVQRHGELLAQRLLADELLQAARAQRAVEVVLGRVAGVVDVDVGGGHAGGADHRRAPFSACAIRSSALPSGAPSSSCSASGSENPRPTRPSRASARGSSARVDDDRHPRR